MVVLLYFISFLKTYKELLNKQSNSDLYYFLCFFGTDFRGSIGFNTGLSLFYYSLELNGTKILLA